MKAYHYLFLFIVLLGSCTLQQQTDTKEQFLQYLSTPVENYDVVYHKESSTAGSGTGKTITISVQNNIIQSYREETQFCGPGDPNEPRCKNCTKLYTAGNWESCDCGTSVNVCMEANKTSDAQLKTDALNYLEKSNTSLYVFLSFTGSMGRTCFTYFSTVNAVPGGGLYCFNEDGLLVNKYSSPPHPVILEAEEYDSESVAETWWNLTTEYIENDPEYQQMRKMQKKESLTTEVHWWLEEGLPELEQDAERLYENVNESSLSEEEKNTIREKVDGFIEQIEEQNTAYSVELENLLLLAENDIDAAASQFDILNQELISYQESIDDQRHDIRREIKGED